MKDTNHKDYLNEICKHKLLTAEQEIDLTTKMKDANETVRNKARDLMVLSNMRLVVHIANYYHNKYNVIDMIDLVSEGTIGLIEAVDDFKIEYKCKFSTYAIRIIHQAIQTELNKHKIIKIPQYLYETVKSWMEIEKELSKNGKRPTEKEIADHLKLSLVTANTIANASKLMHNNSIIPIDSVAFELEINYDDLAEKLINVENINSMREQLKLLKSQEQIVIIKMFGLDDGEEKTLQQVGDELGLTRERIRQIKNKALTKLTKRMA